MACRKRHEGEDFKDYRQRMKNAERNIRQHLKGRVVFDSRPYKKIK